MNSLKEWQKLILIVMVFLLAYFIPFGDPFVQGAILESFLMLQEYAREHVLTCLIPAFFIAGAIANFVSQGAVIKYFGGGAKKWLAYSVAAVSGTVLAVCSCTVLPLFAGIYKRGAGIGPAVAFLYSGPAINVLAIILTARVLGWQLGLARALGAVLFSVVIGLTMSYLCREEEAERACASRSFAVSEEERRSLSQNMFFFAVLVLILIFAAWGRPADSAGLWAAVYQVKWVITAVLLVILAGMLLKWFDGDERVTWVESTWSFAKQIFPLLFAGVLVAGLLMGRPGSEAGLIPARYIAGLVGGNSLQANLLASVVGAFMYFATLTEVPILQGLIGSGMGQGPALALLLAGPALSLPNMLVIRSIIGTKKTVWFVCLVIVMATASGFIFGGLMR
ncbi:MAG: permease [Bacillota bacterium]|nr:permease [Bacillota bacterium]MDW7684052.1 permease [Bacillota bacterium]